jgi:hypothetical protein
MSLKFRYRRWRLRRSQARTDRAYDKDIADAQKAKKGSDALENLRGLQRFEWSTYEDQLMHLETRHLLSQARRLCIPIPDLGDEAAWEEANTINKNILTTLGQHSLRAALRAERKEQTEWLRSWLPAFAAFLSALAAWAAVLIRR